jgi:putative transposase
VVPGAPHHVTQRGNRRADAFFTDSDRHVYLRYLAEYAHKHALDIIAYCLMTNHVHRSKMGTVPRRGTSRVDCPLLAAQRSVTGRLWQDRFYSCPMDEAQTWNAMAYVKGEKEEYP